MLLRNHDVKYLWKLRVEVDIPSVYVSHKNKTPE